MTGGSAAPPKRMRLRYAGTCTSCGAALAAGTTAVYDPAKRTVACVDCHSAEDSAPVRSVEDIASGVAGTSARREHERRRDKREARIREKFPRIGGLILALSDDPQSTTAWATGARGEEQLGRSLDSATGPDVRVLHDRRIPRSRANIDHMVVGPSGVFVIDAKRYKGRPTLRVEGGILRPRVEKLLVGSRDQTKLVTGVQGQVASVLSALDSGGLGHVRVMGMLCFVDADWPIFGGDFTVDDVHVLWPRKAITHVTGVGSASTNDVARVHRFLAEAFPSA